MKLLREILWIFGIYYLSEGMVILFALPLPANLLGLLLLFLCLHFQLIRLDQIATFADFLLRNMSFFFIPAAVMLLSSFSLIASVWMELLLCCVLTTILTMAACGKCVERMMKRREKS